MEEFRSKSCNDGRMQIETYYGDKTQNPKTLQDFRCYSASYASSSQIHMEASTAKEVKCKKGSKSTNGSISKSWSFSDPELRRKKRVASYKVYTVEGNVKGSIRKSFRWLKDKYTQVVYGMENFPSNLRLQSSWIYPAFEQYIAKKETYVAWDNFGFWGFVAWLVGIGRAGLILWFRWPKVS